MQAAENSFDNAEFAGQIQERGRQLPWPTPSHGASARGADTRRCDRFL